METVLITGGTGMIGKALAKELTARGYNVIVLTRQSRGKGQPVMPVVIGEHHKAGSVRYSHWDVQAGILDKDVISIADHIIHLAGASVSEQRWTRKRKQEILESRAQSGKLIAECLKTLPNRVKTVISISGIGYYGPDRPGRTAFTETDEPYDDFLSRVCQQWEGNLIPVTELGKRLVILRSGVVLSNEGGALKEFLKPFRFGFATILGSGKQIVSWIHMADLVKLFVSAIETEKYSGVYNAVAPNPVSNRQFIIELARLKNSFFIPLHVPSFVLRTVLGEMSIEVLKSATVSSEKIRREGFEFAFNTIHQALEDLTRKA